MKIRKTHPSRFASRHPVGVNPLSYASHHVPRAYHSGVSLIAYCLFMYRSQCRDGKRHETEWSCATDTTERHETTIKHTRTTLESRVSVTRGGDSDTFLHYALLFYSTASHYIPYHTASLSTSPLIRAAKMHRSTTSSQSFILINTK